MKLKRNLFCITDNYNKPDFRCLFESEEDATKRIRRIKNSTKGETIFLSRYKRDFFVDGIKKSVVSPTKQLTIKKGCWTTLKVKKLSLLSDVESEKLFKKTKKSRAYRSSFSKAKALELPKIDNKLFKQKKDNFLEFEWERSFLRTRSFAAVCAALVLLMLGGVFAINHQTTNKMNELLAIAQSEQTRKMVAAQAQVLEKKEGVIGQQFDSELNKFVLEALQSFDNIKIEELESEIRKIVAGSPMEEMAPLIAKKDRKVAAFLVGIAKKESNFGRRVPVLNGQDCFNYWGYRGIRARMGSGGHTCFDSPQDAIDTVGGRLGRLVNAEIDTPQEMVLWKCGSACHKDPMAGKWISDVNLYFRQLDDV